MDTYNLLIALIVLTCLLIVFFTIYLVNHHVRRQRKPALQDVDLENNTSAHAQARPDALHENYDEQQRLSHISTVTPSIELLPEIRTSSERAENWLERSDSQIAEGDLSLKMHEVAGLKNEGPLKWDWRGGKDRGEARKKKKDELEKGAGVLDKGSNM
jgi:hypothetical protein